MTVTLKNQGFEAYHHDIYGDHIIVERLVYREGGAGGYKIKSEKTGKIVSTKREELDKILDHMNIQVDNPINVLSQDAARAFLTKSNAKAKYDVRTPLLFLFRLAGQVVLTQRLRLLIPSPTRSSSFKVPSSLSCRRSTTSSRPRSRSSPTRSPRRRRSCPR